MPQMGPMMWFLLMNTTILLLMMTSNINYFSNKKMNPMSSKSKTDQMNWSW